MLVIRDSNESLSRENTLANDDDDADVEDDNDDNDVVNDDVNGMCVPTTVL